MGTHFAPSVETDPLRHRPRSSRANCNSAPPRDLAPRAEPHPGFAVPDPVMPVAVDLGENDPTSRRLMESILAVEEEHAEDLKTLLESPGENEKKA